MNDKITIIRNAVGIIGNAISFFLFVSPTPTFIQIMRKESVEQFRPDPYLTTIASCMLWVFYGLPVVHPDSTLVATINAVGIVIELTYTIIFFIYADKKGRLKAGAWIVIEVVLMAIVVTLTLTMFHTTSKRSNAVGILCVIVGLMMYISPLTIMGKVIKTKSTKYMPFYLSLASFMNGTVWTIYALLPVDPYLIIPNGFGAVSGAVQLILYAYYSRFTPNSHDDHSHSQKPDHTDLQMEGAASV